jgi:branched-chain amino acid transport system substrate-binding protein
MNAYYEMLNEKGGINGRQIKFINYDDAYSPPKSVEAARRLVEGDEVLLIAGPTGAPGNTAIQKYMNIRKVPQLLSWELPQSCRTGEQPLDHGLGHAL